MYLGFVVRWYDLQNTEQMNSGSPQGVETRVKREIYKIWSEVMLYKPHIFYSLNKKQTVKTLGATWNVSFFLFLMEKLKYENQVLRSFESRK